MWEYIAFFIVLSEHLKHNLNYSSFCYLMKDSRAWNVKLEKNPLLKFMDFFINDIEDMMERPYLGAFNFDGEL